MNKVAFESDTYRELNRVRKNWLIKATAGMAFNSALDVGAGQGYFIPVLRKFCSEVWACDVRRENLNRCSGQARTMQIDLDEPQEIRSLLLLRSEFDFMLMFGILYHIQSPLQVLQALLPACTKVVAFSSIVPLLPGMHLYKEHKGPTNNLKDLSVVPCIETLISIFQHFGFRVYNPGQPNHEQWQAGTMGHCYRTTLLASRDALDFYEIATHEIKTKWQ